jgi:branched-chain amino acid transport system ATP-binding protein
VNASPPLLAAQDLHAWYGSSHVLHGISLSIERGQTLGLLGRNGMGKSTLIRTIFGHVALRQGRIVIGGHDLSRARPHQVARHGLAYVPEGRGVFANLSVHENLVMAARPGIDGQQRWTQPRVLQTFPRLAERLSHLGGQLSGGEQQMLAIGRALMTNPSLIILDEATEGLAPQIVDEIWRVVASLRADGLAALIVDRDYRRVAAHADRLLVLQKGQVLLQGPADELRQGERLARCLGI